MIIYKCKMCGGNLNIVEGSKVATCEYCQTQQTVPSTDDEKRANLFNRANHFRQNSEFDKAMGIYEHILEEDSSDAEAYWSIVLCKYGIEYVEDPATKIQKPTVNRTQAQSILKDADYLMALEHADYAQKVLYEKEAKEIDQIQRDILQIAQSEKPYDIFISYKEKASSGERTKSSVLAQDVYSHLTKEGYRVFFSRISLEDKVGQKYEPYIYSALNSAKVMLVIGTQKEEFMAPWVRNEWSRFLTMMREDTGKLLIPCFKDIDIDDLPNEFQILQSQDMTKIGFEQDLLHGISKLFASKQGNEYKVQNDSGTLLTFEKLYQNMEMCLAVGDVTAAYKECAKITRLFPERYEGWWANILARTFEFRTVEVWEDTFLSEFKDCLHHIKELAPTDIYEKCIAQFVAYIQKCSMLQAQIQRDAIDRKLVTLQENIDKVANLAVNQSSVLAQSRTSYEAKKKEMQSRINDLENEQCLLKQKVAKTESNRKRSRIIIIVCILGSILLPNIFGGNVINIASVMMAIGIITAIIQLLTPRNTSNIGQVELLRIEADKIGKQINSMKLSQQENEARIRSEIDSNNKLKENLKAESRVFTRYIECGKEEAAKVFYDWDCKKLDIPNEYDGKFEDLVVTMDELLEYDLLSALNDNSDNISTIQEKLKTKESLFDAIGNGCLNKDEVAPAKKICPFCGNLVLPVTYGSKKYSCPICGELIKK